MKIIIYILSALFILSACTTIPVGFQEIDKNELSSKIENIFNDTLFSHAHWGVLVQSLNTGETIYERNSNRMFMPASNEKIPTAAAALIKLGPNFRFNTTVGYSGSIIDSVLYGNLIIVGDGDPTISDRIYEKPTSIFENWADSLKTLGINRIDGNIIGDDDKFDDEHIRYGWPYSGLQYWYSAEVGALQLNENYVDLMIIPPKGINDTLEIIPDVKSNYYNIHSEITITDTGKNDFNFSREFGENNIFINAEIVRGSNSFERSPTITNPTMFYVTVLKEVFEEKGITVSGSPIDCDDLSEYPDSIRLVDTLFTHYSMELSEILAILMKKSQNLYAETLVNSLGLFEIGTGSFEEGKKVVENVLIDFGINPKTYSYRDGSGLSRYNFISPQQIVKILKGMRESDHWAVWKEIFPIAGVDGTLKWRMRGTKAEGNVKAKTGTISNVRGLSGYLTTSEGEEIIFSFLLNGHLKTSRDTEIITDKVLELISEYPLIRSGYYK